MLILLILDRSQLNFLGWILSHKRPESAKNFRLQLHLIAELSSLRCIPLQRGHSGLVAMAVVFPRTAYLRRFAIERLWAYLRPHSHPLLRQRIDTGSARPLVHLLLQMAIIVPCSLAGLPPLLLAAARHLKHYYLVRDGLPERKRALAVAALNRRMVDRGDVASCLLTREGRRHKLAAGAPVRQQRRSLLPRHNFADPK